jgi:hypothetical protein
MACKGPSDENLVKARVLALRRGDPNLSYDILAQRTGAGRRSIVRWLQEAGLGQGLRTEDARGQTPARRNVPDLGPRQITRAHLDALDEFDARDDWSTARPRNDVLADLCPESL